MALVTPEIQRQVQGLTTIRPEQKAVKSGSALAGALTRTQGSEQARAVGLQTRGQQMSRGLRDTKRNLSTAKQDVTGANIVGGVDVGLAGLSARDRVGMAERQKKRKQEEQVGFQSIMDFINTQPERTREIMTQFGLI